MLNTFNLLKVFFYAHYLYNTNKHFSFVRLPEDLFAAISRAYA